MFGSAELVMIVVSGAVLLIMVAGVPLGVWVIIKGTKQKSRLGINLTPTACPECGTALPQARIPKNLRQAMWGGWTCEKCRTELDKWGRRISS